MVEKIEETEKSDKVKPSESSNIDTQIINTCTTNKQAKKVTFSPETDAEGS